MAGPPALRTYSVVIPVFNAERYLREAIESALGQTLLPLEVLVVDDGSTDGSRSVAESFGGRVRLYSGPNAGPSAARNRGVREARGDWIVFLDADDLLEPGYLRTADAHLAANPGLGVLCSGVRILEDRGPTNHVIRKKSPGPAYSTAGLLGGDIGTICTPLVRRDVFLSSGGFDESCRANEDGHLWLRLSRVTGIHQMREPLLLCRRHMDNASGDVLANARESVRSLERLEASHPEFGGEFRAAMRRLRGKEYLRLGRELLVAQDGRGDLAGARAALRAAVTYRPGRLRGWGYLAFAWIPHGPGLVAAFRRRELAVRRRLSVGRAAAVFRAVRS
jgi:glycosyltransferase involved in cell wall biosynthesis